MAKEILQSTLDYLANTKHINLATLVTLELPGEDGQFLQVTDYKRDIVYKGETYEAGKVTSISDITRTAKLTANTISIRMSGVPQEELNRALDSGSYLNRKVTIYRAIILSNGSILPYYADGDTLQTFSGLTTEISIEENGSTTSTGTSQITWKCSNEFYNLDQVNGRITDDTAHRGLIVDDSGFEVPSDAAKKIQYQDDKGFFHANQSIDILASYQTQEKRQKLKKKSSWGGLKTSYKMVDYWVTVTKEVELGFNLAAKYIPVVYGVAKVDGIPVFADTLVDDPTKVFVVYAFCEGEIEGFYDIWFDNKPMICFDAADDEDRVCFGQKRARGDTMGVAALNPAEEDTIGSVHGREYILQDGDGELRMWTFHGKLDQDAATRLVDLAANGEFYRQNSTGIEAGPEYWDDTFKLRDTAYIVLEVDINSQRTNVPTVSAEIKGRKVTTFDDQGLVVTTDSTTSNPAWQQLDYLRNPVFGSNVSVDRIDVASFAHVASLFDIRDVSYEPEWVPYWRYVGWDSDDSIDNLSVVQTNVLLETDSSLFKNMESMLDQSVASLNVVNGQYTLTVESEGQEPTRVGYEDIIDGKVSVSDITSKNKFNTVSAGIPDPGNGWKNTEVTFFEGSFLAEDLGIEKKLNMNFPHITNYYTARSLAERELRKTRFNREVKVTLPFKYTDLKINHPLELTYPRFNWEDKSFLIRNLSIKTNGKVAVTLREYSEGIFINSPKVDKGDEQQPQIPTLIKPPREASFVPSSLLDPEDQGVNKQGEVRWLRSYTSDVTYYSIVIAGVPEAYIVSVDQFPVDTPYYSLDIVGLSPDSYVVQIRAVAGARGVSSSPATLNMEVTPSISLHPISNLILTNPSTRSGSTWIGPEPLFSWDVLDGSVYGIPQGEIKYRIQVLDTDPSQTVLSEYTTTGNTGNYPISDNIGDYLLNLGAVGAYRAVGIRVLAFTDTGAESTDWAYINK